MTTAEQSVLDRLDLIAVRMGDTEALVVECGLVVKELAKRLGYEVPSKAAPRLSLIKGGTDDA